MESVSEDWTGVEHDPVMIGVIMAIDPEDLPTKTCLVRVLHAGRQTVALWESGKLRRILLSFDELLKLPASDMAAAIGKGGDQLEPAECTLLAPVESQEVWACGVTYLRSRDARMEESQSSDVYARVYAADRPELFFKAAGWRVVAHGGDIGIRPDSEWNVPEPELAVLSNSLGEVVAFACGNDMSSRSIEGENPLYLPQAKVYDRSCSIGPAAALAWSADPSRASIRMRIERDRTNIFTGVASVTDMVRDPRELAGVLHAAYPLPVGAWLLTGTSLVPPLPFTAAGGDVVSIEIDDLGRLVNRLVVVPHTGASARPRLPQ